jgi:hypothetical protein
MVRIIATDALEGAFMLTVTVPIPWLEVVGFAGFGLFLPAVAGAADPCSRAAAMAVASLVSH